MHESLITILQPFLKILNPKKKASYQVYGVFFCLKEGRSLHMECSCGIG